VRTIQLRIGFVVSAARSQEVLQRDPRVDLGREGIATDERLQRLAVQRLGPILVSIGLDRTEVQLGQGVVGFDREQCLEATHGLGPGPEATRHAPVASVRFEIIGIIANTGVAAVEVDRHRGRFGHLATGRHSEPEDQQDGDRGAAHADSHSSKEKNVSEVMRRPSMRTASTCHIRRVPGARCPRAEDGTTHSVCCDASDV